MVIDTGIDLNSSFFGPDANNNGVDDRIVFSYDFSGSDDSNASDTNGHGSNVASIIGSQNATYPGMAPGVNIIALKVFPDGPSPSGTNADIQQALDWVVANRAAYNIVAVNMSLGTNSDFNAPIASPYASEFANLAANNTAVVVASGNNYYAYQAQGVASPSADPNAWSIGAVWDRNAGSFQWQGGAIDYATGPDHIISFSQRSTTMTTIFAPGGQITGANWDGGTVTESGTSQAAPHISGLVADMQQLALQVSGHLMSVSELKLDMLKGSVTIFDGDDENDDVANTNASYQRVDALGWGIQVLNDLFAGTTGNDTLNGTAAGDTIHGNSGNDTLYGNGGGDTIFGDDGNDLIDGGVGADTMAGGTGDDTYIVDNPQDTVTENANEGTDLVQSSVGFTLGPNVENLTLIGAADINGTGNDADNTIIGNGVSNVLTGGAGNDTLDGNGGPDTLIGGTGDDTYIVNDVLGKVSEKANEGIDLVQSSVTFTLAVNIENLTLTGSGVINGTGNAADNTIIGNSGSNVLNGGVGADTLIGGAGNDTYIVDNVLDTVTESTNEGIDLVQSSISYALGNNLENLTLTGSGDIDATGNAGSNVITGTSGNNTLDGGTGADTLTGGAGDDTYVVDDVLDKVMETANAGSDLVLASVSYALSANVESLTLTGSANIDGTGNTASNAIAGNAGNNVLNGGAGADTLTGGAGDDTYVVDNVLDAVIEDAGDGSDLVLASVSYTLAANVENLTLTGSGFRNGTGNAADNTITGNAANNVLDGGAGTDTLIGGAGNDTYVVDNVLDTVIENADEGTDLVQASVNYTLGINVENLTLTGSTDIDGTGNTANNTITGNSGNNTLDGGVGTDRLIGGAGDDTYVVDNVLDRVIENAGEGTDLVRSSIGYTLGANIENLTLTGMASINGTGNDADNTIMGNVGNNVLDGGGGADTLIGGAGNDTYVVDSIQDRVIENTNEGTDLVRASVSYVLGANLENLTLTGSTSINGTGNAADNTITGNAGNNILNGGAGGMDKLVGGAGDDTYVVDNIQATLIENANQGTDLVKASISFTLAVNFENLTLTGSGDINGIGNAASNTIMGNAGNNLLDGQTGADTMAGQLGDDIYLVDNIGDVVSEAADQGTDKVESTLSYTLPANVENLLLLGSAKMDGTGNALANTIIGNAGSNQLTGGAGDDALYGQDGNDILNGGAVSSGGTNQLWGGLGSDTASYVGTTGSVYADLGAQAGYVGGVLTDQMNSIENLVGGSGNDVLVGDAGANVLTGGAGADQLYGGAGADQFVYAGYTDSNLVAGYDTIADFASGVDTLDLTGLHTSIAHVTINSGDGSTSLYVEQTAGTFNPATDLAISFDDANAITMGDIKF